MPSNLSSNWAARSARDISPVAFCGLSVGQLSSGDRVSSGPREWCSGAKARFFFGRFTARLKSCPDTMPAGEDCAFPYLPEPGRYGAPIESCPDIKLAGEDCAFPHLPEPGRYGAPIE